MEHSSNEVQDLTAFEIEVQYLNHRIKTRVFKRESLDNLMNRVSLSIFIKFVVSIYSGCGYGIYSRIVPKVTTNQ